MKLIFDIVDRLCLCRHSLNDNLILNGAYGNKLGSSVGGGRSIIERNVYNL